MKTRAMKIFTHGLLPSCTTPKGPAITFVRNPSPVNRTMIPTQNTTACNTPSRRVPDCRFTKYETVNGIIGKTQGVKIAASPAPNAVRRNKPKPACLGAGGGGGGDVLGAAAASALRNSVYPAGITMFSAFAAGSTLMVATAVFFLGG